MSKLYVRKLNEKKKNTHINTQQTYSNITTVLNDKRTYRKTDRLSEKKNIEKQKRRKKKQ